MISLNNISIKGLINIKWLFVFSGILLLLTLVQDYLGTVFQGGAYYPAESVLFSSFWILFIPLLVLQLQVLVGLKRNNLLKILLGVTGPVFLHLILFSVLIWMVSGLFYEHQFEIRQTLWFTITEYLYVLLAVYSIPVIWSRRRKPMVDFKEAPKTMLSSAQISHLLLTDGARKIPVPVQEILYMEASSPYIQIYLDQKKYLHKGTLKSIEEQLDPAQFIRVHKSFIVNLKAIRFYTSRQNGDYDLTLMNTAVVRLSRNYVTAFRKAYGTGTQDSLISTQDT
ncbi:LytR/AlgR family response regulator transcription factor [Flavihumibacter sp. UBA7668]|uniref:LytR/AlgR family response regulator transcription factor n=1 Tax=Flavihumibacter sp. UBA7668 TaxID=1946542 RepID=UPI0025BD4D85|nr:LytTR family DNA-binding domain-containing protein [Flavihumibacter sp. UBA7668]